MKKQKAYRVQIGFIEDENEFDNFDSRVVVAVDVVSAMRKIKLRKNCFVSQVEIITRIDKI